MKIIIYGINDDTLEIIKSIKKENNVVAISDSFLDKKQLYGYPFIKPDNLNKIDFDYIVVCVRTRKTFEIIKQKLVCYEIEESKILSFHNLYYESRVDQVMLEAQANNRVFDGLIMGISHAAYAINPKFLLGEWANIAVPSEDIINHNYVIDKLINNYFEQISCIKRVIVDLYDYSILNFITSRSRYNVEFYDLYCGDGIEYQNSFEQLEKEILNRNNYSSYYARYYRKVRQKIFNDIVVFSKYNSNIFKSPTPIDFFYKECVYSESEIGTSTNGMSFIPKVQRENNIENNKTQLLLLIEKIYKINPKMEVFLVLIPRVAEAEKKLMPELVDYKKELYLEIKKLEEKYSRLYLLDYKGINDISLYKEGYCSVGHMNIKGSKNFTKILNKDIFKEDL